RWGLSITHRSHLRPDWGGRWSGYIDYAEVSDDDYFRDLSGNLSIATQSYLKQDALVRYNSQSRWWSAYVRVQKFQVLQDTLNPLPGPFERLPQLVLNVLNQQSTYLDLGLRAEFVAFDHPTRQTGQRLIAYPSIALPLSGPGAYIKPKVGVHATWYNLSDFDNLDERRPTRSLPIASVDTGLVFERDMNWLGVDWLQTLEPRLYYLYVPYRDQDEIPLFDTTLADF